MNWQIIPTGLHAFEDYMTAAMLPVIPRTMGWSKPATALMDGAAIAAAGQSMMTDYEGGLVPVIPMKAHLAVDALLGATFLASAALMEDEPTDVRATLAGLGVFSLAMAIFTKRKAPSRGNQQNQGGWTSRPTGGQANLSGPARDAGRMGDEHMVAPGTGSPDALNRLNSEAPGLGTLADQANKGNLR